MHTRLISGLIAATIASFVPGGAEAAEPQMAHMVFFKLKDRSGDAKERLVAACNERLSGHEGVVHYSAGVIASDMKREVNDREFDVSLHLVFANQAAHEKYQKHPRHLKFVEEHSAAWESVRVFDSYLARLPKKDKRVERIPLPDPAAHFAGMIRGKVVAKRKGAVVVAVDEVAKVWKTNRAKDAKALVGKKVLVTGNKVGGHAVKPIARFIAALKVGQSVALDVAHRTGEALVVVELLEDQRQQKNE